MRPFDLFFSSKYGQTDGPTGITSYRNAFLPFCDVCGPPWWHARKKNLYFPILKITGYGRTYGWTDGRTNGRTDRRTDRPYYRDARTHLKNKENLVGSGQKWLILSDWRTWHFDARFPSENFWNSCEITHSLITLISIQIPTDWCRRELSSGISSGKKWV